jgi:hypothetical protein
MLTGQEMLVGGERHLLVFRGRHHLFVVNSITNEVVFRMQMPVIHLGDTSLVTHVLNEYEKRPTAN